LCVELERFFSKPWEEKSLYALKQFDQERHSPNQLHGFSVVDGLKEQLMIRVGQGVDLRLPESLRAAVDPCYHLFDRICRTVVPKTAVESCLDPDPLPKGYPSSAILDCFYYYGKEIGGDRFHNNHASHTDSGTLTLVVCSDEPALEVFDQKEQCWIAIEQQVHEMANNNGGKSHREFATLFWGDSVTTLEDRCKKSIGQPCFHRVASCNGKSRVSVVFKQRSAPLKTFCRYQEDYLLSAVQIEADEAKQILHNYNFPQKKLENFWRISAVVGITALTIVMLVLVRSK